MGEYFKDLFSWYRGAIDAKKQIFRKRKIKNISELILAIILWVVAIILLVVSLNN